MIDDDDEMLARPTTTIQSVERACLILNEVAKSTDGLTRKQISERCRITLMTVYHQVATLTCMGYLVCDSRNKDEGGAATYILGPSVRALVKGDS